MKTDHVASGDSCFFRMTQAPPVAAREGPALLESTRPAEDEWRSLPNLEGCELPVEDLNGLSRRFAELAGNHSFPTDLPIQKKLALVEIVRI
jgi:hypothetical protein